MGEHDAFIAPSPASTAAFLAVIALVLGAMITAVRRAMPERRNALTFAVLGWAAITALPSASGIVRSLESPAPLIAFFAVCNVTALVVALSPIGRRIAALPLTALIGFQAFRLPLELVLHRWHAEGSIPVQMTFGGHNFDVVTGTLALALAVYGIGREIPRAWAWGFNVMGSALLLAVMTIALTSSPVPARLYSGQPLLLGYYFPYAWIVPLAVAPALAGHVIVFRALLARTEASPPRRLDPRTAP
ncbi:MAG: hypothetical protein AB7S26_38380 [Sandaracinaceae bacterium]